MSITSNAVWHIESRLTQPLSLSLLAELCAVSPYHLSRTFRSTLGLSPMVYLRGRRLSHAALRLAHGNDDILTLALEIQYSSHEAFTRAFASCFGVLPSTVRRTRSTKPLKLMEAIEMDKSRFVNVAPPELKDKDAFAVIGLGIQCTFENTNAIPALWQAFNAREREVSTASTCAAYGVCHSGDNEGRFRYLAGVAVPGGTQIPEGMERVLVPAGRYAVFCHTGHISEYGNTVYTIWNKSISDLGLTTRQAPDFEVYDSRFDAKTGRGTVEIWIPVDK